MPAQKTAVVLVPMRLGTIAEVFFRRDRIPPGVDLVHYRQVPTKLPGEICEPFDTVLIDLTRNLDELMRQIDAGTRYEIRRATQRDNVTVEQYECPADQLISEFCNAYNAFAAGKQLPAISRRLTRSYAEQQVLRLTRACDNSEHCVVWHAYVEVSPRARLLYSISTFRATEDRALRAAHGRMNRLLHWTDMCWFKQSGVPTLDLGGWYAGGSDKERLAINDFKKQFGGTVVREYNCRRPVTARGYLIIAAERLSAVAAPMLRLRRK